MQGTDETTEDRDNRYPARIHSKPIRIFPTNIISKYWTELCININIELEEAFWNQIKSYSQFAYSYSLIHFSLSRLE